MRMTWDEWTEKYGWIFPVKPDDKFDIHNIWTMVSSDEGGGKYLCGGFHPVNNVAYYATLNPWGVEDGDNDIEIIPTEEEIEFDRLRKAEDEALRKKQFGE